MKDRYIDNRVLNACIRPQLPKWCGPTTVSEVLTILLKKYICPHEVARLLSWKPDVITNGFGTTAILKAIQKLSNKKIKYEILSTDNSDILWNNIKTACKKGDIVYLHEQGHHVLIAGYIEEPLFTFDEFKNGIDCQISYPRKLPISEDHPKCTTNHNKIHRILIKAEHNVKEIIKADGFNDLLVSRDFDVVVNELSTHPDRLHLVRLHL